MDKVQQIIKLIEKERDYYERIIDEAADEGCVFVELLSKECVLNDILNKIYSFLNKTTMDNLAKTKAEIKKLKEKSKSTEMDTEYTLAWLLDFIDSLPGEPVSKNEDDEYNFNIIEALVSNEPSFDDEEVSQIINWLKSKL